MKRWVREGGSKESGIRKAHCSPKWTIDHSMAGPTGPRRYHALLILTSQNLTLKVWVDISTGNWKLDIQSWVDNVNKRGTGREGCWDQNEVQMQGTHPSSPTPSHHFTTLSSALILSLSPKVCHPGIRNLTQEQPCPF